MVRCDVGYEPLIDGGIEKQDPRQVRAIGYCVCGTFVRLLDYTEWMAILSRQALLALVELVDGSAVDERSR